MLDILHKLATVHIFSRTRSAVSGGGHEVESSSELLRLKGSDAHSDDSVTLSDLIVGVDEPRPHTGCDMGERGAV